MVRNWPPWEEGEARKRAISFQVQDSKSLVTSRSRSMIGFGRANRRASCGPSIVFPLGLHPAGHPFSKIINAILFMSVAWCWTKIGPLCLSRACSFARVQCRGQTGCRTLSPTRIVRNWKWTVRYVYTRTLSKMQKTDNVYCSIQI